MDHGPSRAGGGSVAPDPRALSGRRRLDSRVTVSPPIVWRPETTEHLTLNRGEFCLRWPGGAQAAPKRQYAPIPAVLSTAAATSAHRSDSDESAGTMGWSMATESRGAALLGCLLRRWPSHRTSQALLPHRSPCRMREHKRRGRCQLCAWWRRLRVYARWIGYLRAAERVYAPDGVGFHLAHASFEINSSMALRSP